MKNSIKVTNENKKEIKNQFDFIRINRMSATFAITKSKNKTGYVYSSLGETAIHAIEDDVSGKLTCIKIEKVLKNVSNGTYTVIN